MMDQQNEFYTQCLYQFHAFAAVDITMNEKADALCPDAVKGIMTNERMISDLGLGSSMYEETVLCRAVQCGLVFAEEVFSGREVAAESKHFKDVMASPEAYSAMIISDVLRISPEEFFFALCGSVVYQYQQMQKPLNDKNSSADYLVSAASACYQLGVALYVSASCK